MEASISAMHVSNWAGLRKLEFDLAEMKPKQLCHLHIIINDSEQNDVEEYFGDQLNKSKIRWIYYFGCL